MARAKITKKSLEDALYDIIHIDYEEDEDGVMKKIPPSDKMAKVTAIKQLCAMRGYNSPEEKIVTNKNYTLEF